MKKAGDFVYVEYRDNFYLAKVLSITKKKTGFLWWKKEVDMLLVKIPLMSKMAWENEWSDSTVIFEVPMSDIREGEAG